MHIIPLAFASAGSLAVQLLAVVLVILTRPRPKALLWAFWLSALVISCGFGFTALALFRAKGTFLGTTSRNVSPAIYLIVGVAAVCVAAFAATLQDKDFLADAERTRIDIEPSSGERVQQLVEQLYATPKATVERAKELIKP